MNRDKELNANIRQTLDESVAALDADICSRIRQVRAQAVAKVGMHHANWIRITSGVLVTACVAVFALVILLKSPMPIQTVPLEDLELITSFDNLELLEDLEFYEWLEDDALKTNKPQDIQREKA